MIDKTREIALKTLYKIDKEESYSNLILNQEIKENRNRLNERDIGLISEIVYGVTTWRLTLDEIIKKYSKIKLKKISTWILNILRMGIYQIIFLDKIPKSAAVNESVNLAKRYGHNSSSNFVNAILRKVEKSDYEALFEIEDNIEKISKTTSMPQWIIEELLKNNNIEKVQEICENLNLRPKISIRINKLKNTKEEFLQKLKERNIEYTETENEDFLILEKTKNIEQLDLFRKGFFTIQDISAGLTAKILDPKPGEKVLDVCAAPGGKTTYIAELMNNEGSIEAWDIYEHRIKLIKENAKRLGINIIKTKVKDASILDENLCEKFDKILLDVPCMGIGVIKRKPDIKWKRRKEDIEEISKIQQKILEICSKYLKEEGFLVYSTCSIFKIENASVIENFLSKNQNFLQIESDTLNIMPEKDRDGFYISKLQKRKILQ